MVYFPEGAVFAALFFCLHHLLYMEGMFSANSNTKVGRIVQHTRKGTGKNAADSIKWERRKTDLWDPPGLPQNLQKLRKKYIYGDK